MVDEILSKLLFRREKNSRVWWGSRWGSKKSLRVIVWELTELDSFFRGGVDGARTRDLWRDRPAL